MRKICLLLLTALLFCGCGIEKQSPKKLKSLDFTVLAPEEMPEELLNVLEEKKTSPFKVTYKDEGYPYICEGYGEQKSSGYSIAVKDLYLTENAVYVDTELLGPGNAEKTESLVTCPYIVLKLEDPGLSVVFE